MITKAPAGAFSIAAIDNPGLAQGAGLGIMTPHQGCRASRPREAREAGAPSKRAEETR